MTTRPQVSIIIPTHNRPKSLRRTLNSLALQNYPTSTFEVLVIADGCNDNTVQMARQLTLPFSLKVLEQNGAGAATARNFGAANAQGRLLIFIDDDVEVLPGFLEAHVKSHDLHPNQVTMGYLPPQFDERLDFFRIGLRCWWEEQFYQMSLPDHRFTYQDLLSGNFSLSADLFRSVGGFDPAFRCREDFELGYRLIKSNAQFAFSAEAKGFHFDASTLERAFQRVFAEGRADVAIARRHPELRAPLLFYRMENFTSRAQSVAFRLAFSSQQIGDGVADILQQRLHALEKIRRRSRWRELFHVLRQYWYWRGVANAVGSRSALANLLQSCPLHPHGHEIEVDLRGGIERAECELDLMRPDSVILHYGGIFLGSVPPQPGAEALRGIHLRSILLKQFPKKLLAAIALEHAMTPPIVRHFHEAAAYADQGH